MPRHGVGTSMDQDLGSLMLSGANHVYFPFSAPPFTHNLQVIGVGVLLFYCAPLRPQKKEDQLRIVPQGTSLPAVHIAVASRKQKVLATLDLCSDIFFAHVYKTTNDSHHPTCDIYVLSLVSCWHSRQYPWRDSKGNKNP